MGITVEEKRIQDLFVDLNQRINRLEAGGKAFTRTEEVDDIVFTLDPGEEASPFTQIGFADSESNLNPNTTLYFDLFIDNEDDQDFLWPWGSDVVYDDTSVFWYRSRLHLLFDEPGASNAIIYVKNLDSSPHTYYLKLVHMYLSGQSGSGVG